MFLSIPLPPFFRVLKCSTIFILQGALSVIYLPLSKLLCTTCVLCTKTTPWCVPKRHPVVSCTKTNIQNNDISKVCYNIILECISRTNLNDEGPGWQHCHHGF